MSEKRIKSISAAAAIIGAAAAVLMYYPADAKNLLEILYYPFQLIADLLRKLSLSGTGGNAAAVIFYAAVSLLPCGYLGYRLGKKTAQGADVLLVAMSGFLFYMLYQFINPAVLAKLSSLPGSEGDLQAVLKIGASMVFYSILFGYAAIRLVSRVKDQSVDREFKWLSGLLAAAAAVYAFLVVYESFFRFFGKFESAGDLSAAGFIESDGVGWMSDWRQTGEIPAIILLVLSVIPAWFILRVVWTSVGMLTVMRCDPYGEKMVEKTGQLACKARQTIYASVVCSLLSNGIQLVACQSLGSANFLLSFPILPVVLALAAMIFSRYMEENNRLYEDKQSII